MAWQNELDELRKREAFAEELGGPERVRGKRMVDAIQSEKGLHLWRTLIHFTRQEKLVV